MVRITQNPGAFKYDCEGFTLTFYSDRENNINEMSILPTTKDVYKRGLFGIRVLYTSLIYNAHFVKRVVSEQHLSNQHIFCHPGIFPETCIPGVSPVVAHHKVTSLRHFKVERMCRIRFHWLLNIGFF